MKKKKSGYECAASAKDSYDYEILKSILESSGIPVLHQNNSVNTLFGLSILPFFNQKDDDPLELLVPEEKIVEAKEIIAARKNQVNENSEQLPLVVAFNREHVLLCPDGALPRAYLQDILQEHSFEFRGSVEVSGNQYDFFFLPDTSFPQNVKCLPIKEAFKIDAGLQEAYEKVLLLGSKIPEPFEEAFGFGSTAKVQDELAILVESGKKTGTASLALAYEIEKEEIPKVGAYSIVLDSSGHARCLIQGTKVSLVPFCKVSPEHAAKEGEGDLSLRYWQKIHWQFFSRECAYYKVKPDNNMMVVCEEFTLKQIY